MLFCILLFPSRFSSVTFPHHNFAHLYISFPFSVRQPMNNYKADHGIWDDIRLYNVQGLQEGQQPVLAQLLFLLLIYLWEKNAQRTIWTLKTRSCIWNSKTELSASLSWSTWLQLNVMLYMVKETFFLQLYSNINNWESYKMWANRCIYNYMHIFIHAYIIYRKETSLSRTWLNWSLTKSFYPGENL